MVSNRMSIKWENVQFGFNQKTGDIFIGECERSKSGKARWKGGKSEDITPDIVHALSKKMKFALKKRNSESGKGTLAAKYYGWKLEDGSQIVYIPSGYDFAVAKRISKK